MCWAFTVSTVTSFSSNYLECSWLEKTITIKREFLVESISLGHTCMKRMTELRYYVWWLPSPLLRKNTTLILAPPPSRFTVARQSWKAKIFSFLDRVDNFSEMNSPYVFELFSCWHQNSYSTASHQKMSFKIFLSIFPVSPKILVLVTEN